MIFFRDTLRDGYGEYFQTHSKEAMKLVDMALDLIIAGQQQEVSIFRLVSDTQKASKMFLNNADPDYWFRKEYLRYRTIYKCESEYQEIRSYISGNILLDLGCGDGSFANYLIKQGYDAWGSDIVRYPQSQLIPSKFRVLNSYCDIQQDGVNFDTIFIKSVLHHIEKAKIGNILSVLHYCPRRLIIKEEIIPSEIISDDRLLLKYTKLSVHDQLQFLILMDYFGNVIAQGYDFMNLPFSFQSLGQWKRIFAQYNFKLQKVIPACFEHNTPHKNAYEWMIFDAI